MLAYLILADAVVILHAAYVGFVVFGFALIVIGAALGWSWVRNFWFRAAHLGAIAIVCLGAFAGIVCPLTTLENFLRQKAGGTTYPGSFVGHWAHKLIFYNFPPEVFTASYIVFGLLVVAAFVFAPPRLPHRRARGERV